MCLWLDDLRAEPIGWTRARTAKEAIAIIDQEKAAGRLIHAMSLDHDLGNDCLGCLADPQGLGIVHPICGFAKGGRGGCACDCHATGLDVVKHLVLTGAWPRTKPTVHSANPVGAAQMRQLISIHFTPADVK